MSTSIDEKKLAEAKEKLACHIQPPGSHTSAEEAASPWQKAMAAAAENGSAQDSSCAPNAAPSAPEDFIDADGNVRLTRMTAAGG